MGYRISWSGGKDSTATVILAHQQGIEIDSIDYVDMRYNAYISAQLPFVAEFIDSASERFRQWGYKVRFLKPDKTAVDLAYKRYIRSVYSRNGCYYGATAFLRGMCSFTSCKQKCLRSQKGKQIIGIAIDEPERLTRIRKPNFSLLAQKNITENECFEICKKENLLSPIYGIECFSRDGCFFCPNTSTKQIEFLKTKYRKHYDMALHLVDIGKHAIESIPNGIYCCSCKNKWVKEYYNGKR